jgi:hypothetical protein
VSSSIIKGCVPVDRANYLSIYDAAIEPCQRLNIPLPVVAPPPTVNREEETVALK